MNKSRCEREFASLILYHVLESTDEYVHWIKKNLHLWPPAREKECLYGWWRMSRPKQQQRKRRRENFFFVLEKFTFHPFPTIEWQHIDIYRELSDVVYIYQHFDYLLTNNKTMILRRKQFFCLAKFLSYSLTICHSLVVVNFVRIWLGVDCRDGILKITV